MENRCRTWKSVAGFIPIFLSSSSSSRSKKMDGMYYPQRFSNMMIGYLNLATLLASIPVIGAGLWLAKGSTTTCSSMLQTPLLIVGFVVLLISLAGFVGACFHVAWALWLYLFAIMLLIGMLLGLTMFGFAVTAGGGGTQVPGRPYREYHISDYSSWLQKHMQDVKYWKPALACVVGSKACPKIANWTPMDYLQHDLTPIQPSHEDIGNDFEQSGPEGDLALTKLLISAHNEAIRIP